MVAPGQVEEDTGVPIWMLHMTPVMLRLVFSISHAGHLCHI